MILKYLIIKNLHNMIDKILQERFENVSTDLIDELKQKEKK